MNRNENLKTSILYVIRYVYIYTLQKTIIRVKNECSGLFILLISHDVDVMQCYPCDKNKGRLVDTIVGTFSWLCDCIFLDEHEM